ncbi:glycosyltransferase family 2 protein [bacterium]|nr:glycosyltransferase family 2 protein [bacterium]
MGPRMAQVVRKIVFQAMRPARKFLKKSIDAAKTLQDLLGEYYGAHCRRMESLGIGLDQESSGVGYEPPHVVQDKYLKFTRGQWQYFKSKPKISILLPVYKVKTSYLEEALASIALQTYPNWEVCVVDDASGDAGIDRTIAAFKEKFPGQVHHHVNARNLHISATSNAALAMATGDWCVLLDHDDRLYPNALFEIIRYMNLHPQAEVFYTDEIVVQEDGTPMGGPFFKPAWSPVLNLQTNYCAHLCAYKTSLLHQIGGFRTGFEGSQDHDLIMRASEQAQMPPVHIPFCTYQWRVHPQSTASSIDAKPYAAVNGIKAVAEACQRRGLPPVKVDYNSQTYHYDLQFEILGQPLVSIIIPTRNQLSVVRACVESVLQKSTWKNLEIIIVDNGSDDPATLAWLESLSSVSPVCRVVRDDGPFNFAHLNNLGAAAARGEYLVLLNNDVEVIAPGWIEAMLQYAQMRDIGAVGAQLLYADGSVQHAGGLLLGDWIAGHACRKLRPGDRTYIDALATVRECSFVTAACLMVARAKFDAVGGLEEAFIPNGYGDVDFCLSLSAKGYRHLYVPGALLHHYESKSRGRAIETFERIEIKSRWARDLALDPYLNPNLARGERYTNEGAFPFALLAPKDFNHRVNAKARLVFNDSGTSPLATARASTQT